MGSQNDEVRIGAAPHFFIPPSTFPRRAGEPDERRIRQGIAHVASEAVGHLAGLFIHLAAALRVPDHTRATVALHINRGGNDVRAENPPDEELSEDCSKEGPLLQGPKARAVQKQTSLLPFGQEDDRAKNR